MPWCLQLNNELRAWKPVTRAELDTGTCPPSAQWADFSFPECERLSVGAASELAATASRG